MAISVPNWLPKLTKLGRNGLFITSLQIFRPTMPPPTPTVLFTLHFQPHNALRRPPVQQRHIRKYRKFIMYAFPLSLVLFPFPFTHNPSLDLIPTSIFVLPPSPTSLLLLLVVFLSLCHLSLTLSPLPSFSISLLPFMFLIVIIKFSLLVSFSPFF